jgi:hypothetical protein
MPKTYSRHLRERVARFVAGSRSCRCRAVQRVGFIRRQAHRCPMNQCIFETYVEKELSPTSTMAKSPSWTIWRLTRARPPRKPLTPAWILFLSAYSADLDPIDPSAR